MTESNWLALATDAPIAAARLIIAGELSAALAAGPNIGFLKVGLAARDGGTPPPLPPLVTEDDKSTREHRPARSAALRASRQAVPQHALSVER